MDKGTYVLLVELEEDSKVLRWNLRKGFYVYVGSGMNSLTGRVRRHLKGDKKIHWNVDHLTDVGKVRAVLMIVGERLEVEISEFLTERLEPIPGFGASDLPVRTNLYAVPKGMVGEIFREILNEFLRNT